MAEHTVVVVGSNATFPPYTGNFWVIDFSNAPSGAPTAVSVSCPSTGVVLDCAGTLVAVADCAGDTVTIYDITNPASPRQTGLATLPFKGIGAISFYGGYVLVGQASADSGAQVALIDISNLASPQVYPTTFARITDVTLFGSTAVICGLLGYSNAFQVAKTSDFSKLATTVAVTEVSPWNELAVPFMCDLDGTNAVFSDGGSLFLYGISGGTPTQITPGSSGGLTTSIAIAERGGTSGSPAGGVLLAYAADSDANVELQYVPPPVSPGTTWISGSASLGDPKGTYGEPLTIDGGIAKFCRNIYGTSTILATAGVTQTGTGGAAECVVSLFDVKAGGGSITATRQGARAPVALPNTLSPNNTLAVTTFYTFWPIPWPIPWRNFVGPWLKSIGLG
jgi:hypothetical protein